MSEQSSQGNADCLANHWYWRPGWRTGREFYTWHLTFDGQHDLHSLVTTYQDVLRDLQGLTLVPISWLHITMQGLGFVDEVPKADVSAIVDAVRLRLRGISPKSLTFSRSTVRPEAIALYPEPASAVVSIRNEIRCGMAEVLGADNVPESGCGFTPHLSMAYANMAQSSKLVVAALDAVRPGSVSMTIRGASLIALRRVEHSYVWRSVKRVEFGSRN